MTEIRPISEPEMAVAQDGSAVYVNRFFVQVGPVVRIAFAEQSPTTSAQFRTAVALGHQDAIELANILKTLLKDIELSLEELKAKTATEAQAKAEVGASNA